MSHDRSSSGDITLGSDDAASTVEPESTPRQFASEVARRWKNWAVIAVTAVTAWFLYGINDTWTKDATAFTVFTVAILAYTLVTLYSDLEMA